MSHPRISRPLRAQRAPGPSGVQIGEEQARLRVLAGAVQVLDDGNVRDASVETILGAAGISRRTFYRLYQSKEQVMVALYRLGTARLLDECRLAVSEETDPMRQIQRCVDAHLRNAQELGRLVFVLGGEAQRHESALNAPRAEAHAQLVELLMSTTTAALRHVDPWLVRGLVLALEGVTRFALEDGNEGRNVPQASIDRARRIMNRVATSALGGDGPGVASLPIVAASASCDDC